MTKCGFCGALIPQHLRFSPQEIAVIEGKMAKLEQERQEREKVRLAEEEAKRKAAMDAVYYWP